jgi:carboxymethylenebutenolidase
MKQHDRRHEPGTTAWRRTAVLLLAFAVDVAGAAAPAEPVSFSSRDGKTQLTGYLFKPDTPGPHPAVVMLHGRSGPYSSLAKGVYSTETLSKRHKMWGEFWAERGYLALLVDSFSPRGYPQGFPRYSYSQRPPEVSEQHVRPLDAYGALDYLRARSDVLAGRIGVQGWSNGGMTVLAALAPHPPGLADPTPAKGFRAALAFYPGCRVQEKQNDYIPYAPLLMFVGTEDEEVSPVVCLRFAARVQAGGGGLGVVSYDGAQHAFDDPGRTRQSREANRFAKADSMHQAEAFFRRHLSR